MSIIVADEFDVLLAKCNNVTTSNSTLFLDSSTVNTKTITANGNATQLSLASGVTSRTAGFFNGTTDYVVVPDSADWDFGTGDFNIELLFNAASVAADLVFIDRNAGSDFKFFWDQSEGKYSFVAEGNADLSEASTPTVNTWTKVKVARVSGTITFYVDDVAKGTASVAEDIQGTAALYIGATSTPNTFYSGWLKNLTITKASTLVLDMRFDSPATSPLAPAIAFDGTGDYLSVATSADFNFTGAFTAECFYNPLTPADGDYLFNRMVQSGGYAGWQLIANASTGNFSLYSANSGTAIKVFTYAFTANKWIHVALVRAVTTNVITLYVDGRAIDTVTSANDMTNTEAFTFGSGLTGYLKEIRISDSARYTSAFTPSQTGFTVDANTKLYIKGNEDNGTGGTDSTDIKDSETTPKVVTCKGDTVIKYTEDYRSCIFKDEVGTHFPYPVGSAKVDFFAPFGTGVGYFDGGATTNLSIPDSDDWDMDGALTLECYVRFTGALSSHGNLIGGATGASQLGLYARPDDGGTWYGSVNGTSLSSIFAISQNQWYHFSYTRDESDATRLFVNGTLLNSGTKSGTNNLGEVLHIGGGADPHIGLLDQIRISKGVARYTATFNPPEDVEDASVDQSGFFMCF